jgi:uncharacterized cofD-like protein
MKIAGIGGGTGLPVLLNGLKTLRQMGECDMHITALVAVSDSGGSSGALRRALGIPAMGDIRNCFIALGDSQAVLKALCQHRFDKLDGLAGHSAGNLLLTGLYQMAGDFNGMVRLASQLFQLKDTILPTTDVSVTLCAEYFDGSSARGESNIPLKRLPIRKLWIDPESPLPAPGVLDAIAGADAVVLGPGSLFTSIIPNLLVADVADAIHASPAVKVYVCNLMTQSGETEGYTAADHVRTLQSYLPSNSIDFCVVNRRSASPMQSERYMKAGANLVCGNPKEIEKAGISAEIADLLEEHKGKIRHDSLALARLIVNLALRKREQEVLCAES